MAFGCCVLCNKETRLVAFNRCRSCYERIHYSGEGKKKRWYYKNKELAIQKAVSRYYSKRSVILEQHKKYKQDHPDIIASVMKRADSKRWSNPEFRFKKSIRVASKKLPIASSCSKCGSDVKLERHHPVYIDKHIFSTICNDCHCIHHRKHSYDGESSPPHEENNGR